MGLTQQLELWASRLRSVQEVVEDLGGSTNPISRYPAVFSAEFDSASRKLGVELPVELVSLVEMGGLCGGWNLGQSGRTLLPKASAEVQWGTVDLSLDEIVRAENSRQGWVEACFPDPDNAYDRVWHGKFGFHTVPNGDCLALDIESNSRPVVYLSHDDGEGHGVLLAPTLVEFLERWSLLAFAGPEDWLMISFVEVGGGGLLPRAAAAKEWRSAIGFEFEEIA